MNIIFLIILTMLIQISLIIYLFSRYKVCQPNKLFVVNTQTSKENRMSIIVHGGGKFVIPILQDYKFIDIVTTSIPIELNGIYDKNRQKHNISAIFNITTSTKIEIIKKVLDKFLNQDKQTIINTAKNLIADEFTYIIKGVNLDEKSIEMEQFIEEVNSKIDEKLKTIGLELINVNIDKIE